MKRVEFTICWAVFLSISGLAAPAMADDPAPELLTVEDPYIALEDLELLLRPLDKKQLEVEADGWVRLLQEKVQQIVDSELQVRRKKRELDAIAKQEEQVSQDGGEAMGSAAAPAPEADVELAVEEKNEVALGVIELREERSKIIDRANLVLAEMKKKGGDPEEHEVFVSSVSGLEIDVSDASAAWTAVAGWLRSPEGGVRWLGNILSFLATIAGFWVVSMIVGRIIRRALSLARNLSSLLTSFLIKSAKRIVMLVGVVVGLSQLEINIGPLVAAIGAAGFVVAFALQGTLSNFASGLLILLYRPYDEGDVIDVSGVSGTVKSMSLVTTTISTFDNKKVIVPNNSIWGDVITNVTGSDTRRIDMLFGIGYQDDVDRARTILEELVTSHELVLRDPEPVVRMHELADSSVNLICRPWAKTSDYWNVYWDITHAVKRRFDDEGISIPFPQRDVHVFQEATVS